MNSLNNSFDTSTGSGIHSGDIKVYENKIVMLEQHNFDLKMQLYYLNQKQNERTITNPSPSTDTNSHHRDILSDAHIIPLDYFDLKKANKASIRKIEELESSIIELQSQSHPSRTTNKTSHTQPSSSSTSTTTAVAVSNETKMRESIIASIITERDATLIQELHNQLTVLQSKYTKASDMVDYCTDRIKALQSEINILKSEMHETQQTSAAVQEENVLLKSQVESYNQVNTTQAVASTQLINEKNNLEKALQHMNDQLMHARIENTAFGAKIDDLIQLQHDMQQQYEVLEKQNQKQHIQLIALNDIIHRQQTALPSSVGCKNGLIAKNSWPVSYSELSLDTILSMIEELSNTSPYSYNSNDNNSKRINSNSIKFSGYNSTVDSNTAVNGIRSQPSSSSSSSTIQSNNHHSNENDRHISFDIDRKQPQQKRQPDAHNNNNNNNNGCHNVQSQYQFDNCDTRIPSNGTVVQNHHKTPLPQQPLVQEEQQQRFIDMFKQRELELMYALEEVALSCCSNNNYNNNNYIRDNNSVPTDGKASISADSYKHNGSDINNFNGVYDNKNMTKKNNNNPDGANITHPKVYG